MINYGSIERTPSPVRVGFHQYRPAPPEKSRKLTSREVEALDLAAQGLTSVDIAWLWGYRGVVYNNGSGPTHVRRVWKQAIDKLGADNVTQAVAMALRRGIIL